MPIKQIDSGGNATYLHADQLGSTRLVTNISDTVVGTYTFDAYGTTSSRTGSASTPLQYAGQYLDVESGLYYLRARYYDPATAQFTAVDPLERVGGPLYGYAHDNPLNVSDPAGLLASPVVGPNCQSGSDIPDAVAAKKPDIKQFDAAVRACERIIGRQLTQDERRQLHEWIHDQDMTFEQMVEECVAMFGKKITGTQQSPAPWWWSPPYLPIPIPGLAWPTNVELPMVTFAHLRENRMPTSPSPHRMSPEIERLAIGVAGATFDGSVHGLGRRVQDCRRVV